MDRIYNRAEDKNAFIKGCVLVAGSINAMAYPVSLLENSETKTAHVAFIAVTGKDNTITPIVLSSIADA